MWFKLFIGCCVIGGLLAEQNVTEETAGKEKRQTDHETRTLPQAADRRQHQGAYYSDPEATAHLYAQQSENQYLFRPHQQKTGQEQVRELPQEYLSLYQQLSEHQKLAARNKHAKHYTYDAPNVQNEQYYQQQPQQAQHHNQIQYITEEEYAQIVKQAQAQNQQESAQHGRPVDKQESPKYRPSVQLLETAQDQGQHYPQSEADQYRVQYKSIQQVGSVTPVPKPISSFSFEKELAKLVESNHPLAYQHSSNSQRQAERGQQESISRYTAKPQSSEYAYSQTNANEQTSKQSIKAQYIAPFARATGKPSAVHLQVGPQKFTENSAQKYHYAGQDSPSKQHSPQQYYADASPKYVTPHAAEKHHAGTPSPKIQYYVPKEKNLQVYYQQQAPEKQPIEQHSSQHPMKVVEAPQLQHEKPHKQIQTHRPKPQYITVDKHAEQSRQSIQRSKDSEPPSRSTIFVSQQTGIAPTSGANQHANNEKQHSSQQHKIPPKIDRPLSQEEFQALVDAGYSVVPVPVPVPVPFSQYHAQQEANRGGPRPGQSARHGPVAQASRYHAQQIAAENNPSQVVTYLRPLHIDPFSSGIRGPNKAAP
ncbi:transcription factor SPT20 homolog [Toxorhynchites rutilus septentrionalis]|uniref:transcription factor SPT20 homolog n=1 Tax=Toxorhynchites rutilus septentrionalis TaxID=329112 RepID=UPI002479EDFC|nr:transcription factor SPT20 homolog [Toxorhynchites rutilus septentrionalis]